MIIRGATKGHNRRRRGFYQKEDLCKSHRQETDTKTENKGNSSRSHSKKQAIGTV